MGDAVAVGDDQRRARIGFGLEEGLDRLGVLGAEGHAGDVHVAVAHGHQAQVLLGDGLAGGGELGGRAERRGLGRLAAGVGVDLGVQHQDVDVAAAWPARGPARRSRCRRPSRRRRAIQTLFLTR